MPTLAPILADIMDHDYLAPLLREREAAGRVQGERALLQKLLSKRFGTLPD